LGAFTGHGERCLHGYLSDMDKCYEQHGYDDDVLYNVFSIVLYCISIYWRQRCQNAPFYVKLQ